MNHAEAISPEAAKRPAAMRFIMLTVLIDMISIGLIIPVLPVLVGTFTSSKSEQSYWYMAVTFAFGIANFFGSPILGALSDRFGRRPVLLLGFCGLAINFFATALSTALWMLVAVRLVGGAMQSNIAVANAYVADITPPEDRARRFGLLGAMFGVGFILGPMLGGILGEGNPHRPFFVAGGLALVNLCYGYFVLPESLPADKRRPFEWSRANPVNALSALTRLQGAGPLVAVLAFTGLAQFILYTTWVLYTSFKFGWTPFQNGVSLAVVGVVSVIVQGVLLGRLLKRFSPQRLATIGLVSSALAYLAYGAAPEGWMMYGIIVLNFLGFTVAASFQSIISSAAGADVQGQTMGSVSSLNSLMSVLAPLLGPPLLAVVSHLPQGDWRIGTPFYLGSALQFVGLVLAIVHFRGQRRHRLASQAGTTA